MVLQILAAALFVAGIPVIVGLSVTAYERGRLRMLAWRLERDALIQHRMTLRDDPRGTYGWPR